MTKRDVSYLHTPEVREKRARSIRRAYRKKKREREAASNVIPLLDIPGEQAPILKHAALVASPRGRRAASEADDRIELTKGIVALLFKALGGK